MLLFPQDKHLCAADFQSINEKFMWFSTILSSLKLVSIFGIKYLFILLYSLYFEELMISWLC